MLCLSLARTRHGCVRLPMLNLNTKNTCDFLLMERKHLLHVVALALLQRTPLPRRSLRLVSLPNIVVFGNKDL